MDYERLQREIYEAVAPVLAKHDDETSVITKFVLLVETSGIEGNRAVWTVTNSNCCAWDILGLLQYAIELEKEGMRNGPKD